MVQIAGKPFTQLVNLNILDELRLDGNLVSPTGVVIVSTLDELKQAVTVDDGANTLTFQPTFEYHITGVIDISPYRCIVSPSTIVDGSDRIKDGFFTDNTGAMFTSTDVDWAMHEFQFEAPNGSIFDHTGTGGTTGTYRINGGVIIDCDTIGTMTNALNMSWRSLSVISTQTGGMSFSGTCVDFNVDDGFVTGTTGILLDFGTATFNNILVGGGNRFNGTGDMISGAANSANINAGGFGIIRDNIFTTSGTLLQGITQSDIRWGISGNGNLADTQKAAELFIADGDEAATTITTQDVAELIAGTFTQAAASQFTTTAAGRATYIGTAPLIFSCGAYLQVDPASGANKTYDCFFRMNGTTIITSSRSTVTADAASPVTAICQALIILDTNDFVELVIVNKTDTTNVTASALSFSLTET